MPLVLFAALVQKQEARYDVFESDKKVGVAIYGVAERPGGERTTMLTMSFLGQSTREVSDTDAKGAATGAVRTFKQGKTVRWDTVAYRRDGAAHVSHNDAKGTQSVDVPAPKGSRNDPSELWFRRTTPKPGETAKFQSLDVAKGRWESVRVTYVGKRGGGNLVRQVRAGRTTDFTLDDKGIPLRIEDGGLRLVRR